MANEVVNPFQLFRDDRGNPLAAGKIFVRQNGTSAPGSAFADSDLTIPQQSNPYTLDNYGRVAGDLRWQGLRRIEIFDRNDAHIRTLDDVVTMVDTSGFAINYETVAAMVADTTLEEGDVAETQSYNAGQRQGGARYLVTVSAEAVDDYRVIDLAPAGLQARLLDEQLHRSPFAAGAVGDLSTDDTDAVQAVLDAVDDVIIDGPFLVGNLTITASKRLSGGGMLQLLDFAGTDLLSISGSNVIALIDDLVLDGNVTNQLAERQTALISSTVVASAADTLAMVRCNSVTFQNASQHDVLGVGNDAGFPVVYALSGCDFIDGEQSTDSTATACVRMEDGASAYVDDCYFSLGAAVDVGRAAVTTGNSGTALVNYGDLMLSGCTLNLMGQDSAAPAAAVDLTELANVVITGNRLLTPNYAGIRWGAEINGLVIADNLVDGLTGDTLTAQLESVTTAIVTPGASWLIQGNELLSSGARAIALVGSTGGADVAGVRVASNVIEGPTTQAITYTDLANLGILDNFVNMDGIAGINAVQAVTNGISGLCQINGNEIINVDPTTGTGGTGIDDQVSTAGSYQIDGNLIEGGAIGLEIDGPDEVFLTNNVFDSITDTLASLDNLTTAWVDGNSYVGANPTTFLTAGTITNLKVGENFWQQLAAAITNIAVTGSNITVAAPEAHYHTLTPTGATSIDSISSPAIDGFEVTYQNTTGTAITLNDALGNLNLGAATRVLGDATDTIRLVWNQLNSVWNEVAFSNN